LKPLLLDTNHLGAALDEASPIRARVLSCRDGGQRIGTCSPVLCELAAGIEQTARRDHNWNELALLLRQVKVWPIDLDAVRAYGDIYGELRAKGRVLSQVDIMVAALARRSGLIVLTTDRDFEAVSGIDVENWVSG
jgi:predicted nucleic acid-binding protein